MNSPFNFDLSPRWLKELGTPNISIYLPWPQGTPLPPTWINSGTVNFPSGVNFASIFRRDTIPCHPNFPQYCQAYRANAEKFGIDIAEDGRSLTQPVLSDLLKTVADRLQEIAAIKGMGQGKHLTILLGISGDIDSAACALLLTRAIEVHGLNCSVVGYHVVTDRLIDQRKKRLEALERYINTHAIRPTFKIEVRDAHKLEEAFREFISSPTDINGNPLPYHGHSSHQGRSRATQIHDLMVPLRTSLIRNIAGAITVAAVEATEIAVGNFTRPEVGQQDWDPVAFLPKDVLINAFWELCSDAEASFKKLWQAPLKHLSHFYPRMQKDYTSEGVYLVDEDNPFSPVELDFTSPELSPEIWEEAARFDSEEFIAIPGRIQLLIGPIIHKIYSHIDDFLFDPKHFVSRHLSFFHDQNLARLTCLLVWNARSIALKDEAVLRLAFGLEADSKL